jgi:hypothetical protein
VRADPTRQPVGACLALAFATFLQGLPHSHQQAVGALKEWKSTVWMWPSAFQAMKTSDAGWERQISPDETEATCLVTGQHKGESYGGTRRRRRPSAPWNRLQREQTTTTKLHRGRRFVANVGIDRVDVVGAMMPTTTSFGVCGERGLTKADAPCVSGVERIPGRPAEGKHWTTRPYQAGQ